MRTLASLEHYFTTSSADGLQLHQYAPMRVRTLVGGQAVELDVATGYPWDGTVAIEVAGGGGGAVDAGAADPGWASGRSVGQRRPAERRSCRASTPRSAAGWARGDVVTLTLSMPPRPTRPRAGSTRCAAASAIERGRWCTAWSRRTSGPASWSTRSGSTRTG